MHGLDSGNFEKFVVLADLHGQDALLHQVLDYYKDDVGLISVGDIFDSPTEISGIRNCLDLFRDNRKRMQLLLANHEWAALGAMMTTGETQEDWINGWRGYENNTLRSYGLNNSKSVKSAKTFEKELKKSGHLDLLLEAPLYFEGDEFIAVHAGLSRAISWKTQKAYLDETKKAMLQGEMDLEEFPLQIYSHVYGADKRRPSATEKTVVTGHTPTTEKIKDRTTAEGRRVRLATRIHNPTEPLLVWESWSREIRPFHKDYKQAYDISRK